MIANIYIPAFEIVNTISAKKSRENIGMQITNQYWKATNDGIKVSLAARNVYFKV